jgi:hypothetical protein
MSDCFEDEPVEENPEKRSPQEDFEPVTEQELLEIEMQTRGFGV